MNRFRIRPTFLQSAVHLYVWGYIAVLAWAAVTDQLTANPVQALEQRTGQLAITLLLLSLGCRPASIVTGWAEPLKRARTLGLYAFTIACVHFALFLALDFNVAYMTQIVLQKPYILVGSSALLLLIPLVITSYGGWKARLGKAWKRLHRFVYVISPLVVLHVALSVKGDFFHLRGDIGLPLQYAGITTALLCMRLPPVRHAIIKARRGIAARLRALQQR